VPESVRSPGAPPNEGAPPVLIDGPASTSAHASGSSGGRRRQKPELPPHSGFTPLAAACERISRHRAEALVVSLGLDAYAGDPISTFTLDSDDFLRLGARIARIGLPTVFILEGGYAVEHLGVNAANVLAGFASA